jgi:hypothetical protein
MKTGYLTAEEFAMTLALVETMRPAMAGNYAFSAAVADTLEAAESLLGKRNLTLGKRSDIHSEMLPRIEAAVAQRQKRDLRVRYVLDCSDAGEMGECRLEVKALHSQLALCQSTQSAISREVRRPHACRHVGPLYGFQQPNPVRAEPTCPFIGGTSPICAGGGSNR